MARRVTVKLKVHKASGRLCKYVGTALGRDGRRTLTVLYSVGLGTPQESSRRSSSSRAVLCKESSVVRWAGSAHDASHAMNAS
jgi:hypothetical protein